LEDAELHSSKTDLSTSPWFLDRSRIDKFVLDVPNVLPIEENPAKDMPLEEKSNFWIE